MLHAGISKPGEATQTTAMGRKGLTLVVEIWTVAPIVQFSRRSVTSNDGTPP